MKRHSLSSGTGLLLHGAKAHKDGAKRSALSGMLVLALLLTGCGGGGSSSGGATPAGVGAAGTYGGTLNLTLSGGPAGTVDLSGPVNITVNPSGMVTVDTGDPVAGSGALAGDTFDASQPLAPIGAGLGISCTGNVVYHGTVSGGSISGSVSSTGTSCNGMSASFSGSFTATKLAKSRRGSGNLLMDALDKAMSPGR